MPDSSAVSTAVQGVDSSTLAGNTPLHDFSIIGMFMEADWIVKIVLLILLFASFWCWAIIFEKYFLFRTIKAKAQRFENDFWSSDALDKFYEKVKKRANHPMAIIFVAAMEEWFRSKNSSQQSAQGMKLNLRERIVQVMQVARNRELEHVESGLGFLATTGSSAPFIGLFGTVWGIMHSFHGIALSRNTSLVAVAPGIAEALFATAIGLFAAIPAVIAYNKFASESARFANKLEDFSTEFDTILSRQLEG
ncbi:MAG: protein TolQ [Pseudomonadota bacterium]|nr:protein TolQ [Pseudomonadota bacterium]MDE3037966.1 protein TolQ [Pseudomonadota bacterium]